MAIGEFHRPRGRYARGMTSEVFPDPATPYGARVRQRLGDETVIWMTTTGADGTPQPNPVWFIVEGDTLLIYNRAEANRLVHIRRNPRVSLNLDSNGHGGDIVVLTGRAEILPDQPPSHEVPAYLAKYEAAATRISGTVEAFSEAYPVAVRVTVDRVRGF
jgi:PPOX class probable F420-dependent enzyme